MKLQYNRGSFFSVKGIPIRYICLVLAIVTFIFYLILGKKISDIYPDSISGIVKEVDINYQKKIGTLTLNIALENNDTVLVQQYYIDIPAKTVFGIDADRLRNLLIPKNSKIISYYDKQDEKVNIIAPNKVLLRTYGIKVNETDVVNINSVGFFTFKVSIWGTISFLLVIASFLLFGIDTFVLYKNTKSYSAIISSACKELIPKFEVLRKRFKNKNPEDLNNSEFDDYVEMCDLYWIAKNNYVEAEKKYINFLNFYPENILGLFMFSQMLISNNEKERADVLLEKVFQLDNNYKATFIAIFTKLDDQERVRYWQHHI